MSPFSSCPLKAWCIVEEVVRWKLLPRANKAILWVWMCASKNYSRDYGQTSWDWDGHNAIRFVKAMKKGIDTAKLLREPHWWPKEIAKSLTIFKQYDESLQVIGLPLSCWVVEYQVRSRIHSGCCCVLPLCCTCCSAIVFVLQILDASLRAKSCN